MGHRILILIARVSSSATGLSASYNSDWFNLILTEKQNIPTLNDCTAISAIYSPKFNLPILARNSTHNLKSAKSHSVGTKTDAGF